MSNKRAVALGCVVLLTILHQDTWNWDDPTLVGGILPMGLAWHGAFSFVAAATWGLVTVYAWPGDPLGEEETP